MNAERRDARSYQRNDQPRSSNGSKPQHGKENKPATKPPKPATGKRCSHHRTKTHSDEECHYQQKNKRAADFKYSEVPDDHEELNAVSSDATKAEMPNKHKSERIGATVRDGRQPPLQRLDRHRCK
ncbi:hypothetical protein PHYBOEH_001563 [Phytophthora boehmeriae]|uniref:Uncharacterized protein n=1 Tax=Phytophthora boehmeriae TaxID=109152 RepID=A0A8T1V8H1_9STRA|nr:hypothetical protein PHYBOEH_001563 [Phytophthora boehmeriae]